MVVRLEDLNVKEEKPKFVPRKKRKANDPPSIPLVDINTPSESIDDTKIYKEQSDNNKSIEQFSAALPEWRINKERELQAPIAVVPTNSSKWINKTRNEMDERDWRIMRRDIQVKSSIPIHPLLHWSELKNHHLLNVLERKFSKPTPIQRSAIESICWRDTDLIAIAPTGSGKTLAFVAPIVELQVQRGLVLAPTRELALQISSVMQELGITAVTLIGGHEVEKQAKQLQSHTTNFMVVATPGRLLDFIDQKLADFKKCEYLVFDEADRMIDMGFEPQITRIMDHLNTTANRRTFMFSATWPKEIQQLSLRFLKPGFVKIEIGATNQTSAPPNIRQTVELLSGTEPKIERLVTIIKGVKPPSICFVATKVMSEYVSQQLNSRGIKAGFLHGSMSQPVRDNAIEALRNRTIKCLVATDVASRGVDIPGVTMVINFDLPSTTEVYLHRIGRTGRAGKEGEAVSFAAEKDRALFPDLRNILRASGCTPPEFLSK